MGARRAPCWIPHIMRKRTTAFAGMTFNGTIFIPSGVTAPRSTIARHHT
jgi:hypothetical protein